MCNGKWCNCFVMRSLCHKELLPIYRDWYPESSGYKKIKPRNIEIDKAALLHWFLDDGSTSFSSKRNYENG